MNNLSEQERMDYLFEQWCNHKIEENDIPELMKLLLAADQNGKLNSLMKKVYFQMKDDVFFTEEQKNEMLQNIIQPEYEQPHFRKKLFYVSRVAASLFLIIGIAIAIFSIMGKKIRILPIL